LTPIYMVKVAQVPWLARRPMAAYSG
jgi:hypothetical protein